MAKSARRGAPPAVVIFGDEEYQKALALEAALGDALPPDADRGLAVCDFDATMSEDAGGPTLAGVLTDLNTLPFLTERRVIIIRDADKFISAHREKLENYVRAPSATGTLILVCRSFPRTLRLYKALDAAGGRMVECKKLNARALAEFAVEHARGLGKKLSPGVAGRLVDRIGTEQGQLAAEIEKLALYSAARPEITDADVTELVGMSREERIFAVMDAAALGRPAEALRLWQQVLRSDPAAIYKAMGGMAFMARRWLGAAQAVRNGESVHAIAPRLGMYGRGQELEQILRRQSPARLAWLLAELGDLDWQVKSGLRSMEMGVEALLLRLAV
ncbi:MAG: DNA polymerase III subunit delta [Planctomycetia bacterium]|nr:MAG: DNA polymerase III subunit delta [Planctomycetia bacterium]